MFRRVMASFVAMSAVMAVTSSLLAAPSPVERINICHINEVVEIGLIGTVMSIPLQAWPGHARHFDYQTEQNVGEACGIIE